jgi:predicted nucleotidyltransferase
MTKTASDLRKAGWPHEEIFKYRPWQAVDRYNRESHIIKRRQKAWEVATQAAKLLKTRFGATCVKVFGSLAHGAWFTPRSDVDIYIEGLTIESFFQVEAAIEKIDQGFKVDLLTPEECSEELLRRIEEEGVEL